MNVPYTTTVGAPCRGCNSGWMSRLEVAAAPILLPMMRGTPPTPLSADERRTVAAWTLKTSAMLQAMNGRSLPITSGWHQHLFQQGEPPHEMSVWVDVVPDTIPGGLLMDSVGFDVEEVVDVGRSAHTRLYVALVVTIGVEHLRLQLAWDRFSEVVSPTDLVGDTAIRAQRLWPL